MTDDDVDFPPSDGPTSGISVTSTAGTLQGAAQRQIACDSLDELIADFDRVHGPADPEAVAAKRARLTGDATNAEIAV
ncbi:hypothetical protein [Streptomyces seoulensis]|uniref:hypothetical protein n=1 Tax=Streptomyces seoulensis TaxID=73044 RepID=UPI001FCCDC6B|nr:hypothetical protein [Streptomyces seoulensis]BDH08771.1 hypothetical protein HEK131_59980 [Streptomyces seoulensis]